MTMANEFWWNLTWHLHVTLIMWQSIVKPIISHQQGLSLISPKLGWLLIYWVYFMHPILKNRESVEPVLPFLHGFGDYHTAPPEKDPEFSMRKVVSWLRMGLFDDIFRTYRQRNRFCFGIYDLGLPYMAIIYKVRYTKYIYIYMYGWITWRSINYSIKFNLGVIMTIPSPIVRLDPAVFPGSAPRRHGRDSLWVCDGAAKKNRMDRLFGILLYLYIKTCTIIWRFPEMMVALVLIHLQMGFSLTIYFGVNPMETPIFLWH